MRQIKFRGKAWYGNGGPNMLNRWMYGGYSTDDGSSYIHQKIYTPGKANRDRFVVSSESVGQFTGLCDVNGREIYEGDILQLVNGQGNYFLVYWNEPTFSFCLREYTPEKKWRGCMMLADTASYKWVVAGNTTDNPELTKQT